MRRRWTLLIELAALAVLCAVLGWWMLQGDPHRPADAIDIKVQLPGARDRVYLFKDGEQYRYRVVEEGGRYHDHDAADFARRLHTAQTTRGTLERLLNVSTPLGLLWVAVGLLGQVLFTGRMIVQWLVSEKERRSVVPPVFWWMSLIGSTMLLVYFLWRRDPVGILGQAFGWFIYVRNLWMIYGNGRQSAEAQAAAERSG